MRLACLLLRAFGPFTDARIDFATDPGGRALPDLHLIVGPNEAGKSSILRAMTDLRFGIPMRSQDNFVHSSRDLCVAGIFIGPDGQPVGLMRRKGRGQTLSQFDVPQDFLKRPTPTAGRPQTRSPTPPALESVLKAGSPVPQALESALTGELSRDAFETLFGLDHARLRAAGAMLLRGEGELGATLFEASAGTQGIGAVLEKLDADAKAIFNPHGHSRNARINEARRQMDEQRQQLRQAQIRPLDWQNLKRAHEQATSALQGLDEQLETLHRQQNEFAALRTVWPLLRELDQVREALLACAPIPDLAPDAREQRLAAQQALQRAGTDLQEARAAQARCKGLLNRLTIDSAVLQNARAIERLKQAQANAAAGRLEAAQEAATIRRGEHDLRAIVSRITALTPDSDLEAVLQAIHIPSNADRIMLQEHLADIDRLTARGDTLRQRISTLAQPHAGPQATDAGGPGPLDAQTREHLTRAIAQGHALGDVAQRCTQIEQALKGLRQQLKRGLADLGTEDLSVLRGAAPLLDAQIMAAQAARQNDQQTLRDLQAEDQRLHRDIELQRARLDELAATGEFVTVQTLHEARAARDARWHEVRSMLLAMPRTPIPGFKTSTDTDPAPGADFRTPVANRQPADQDAARAVSDSFETSQRAADQQADLLRANAEQAAVIASCQARITQMQARRTDIGHDRQSLQTALEAQRSAWQQTLAQARLPLLEPQALREWQGRRASLLDLADQFTQQTDELQALQAQSGAALAALTDAMHATGRAAQRDWDLASALAHAMQLEAAAAQAEADRKAYHQAESRRTEELRATARELEAIEVQLNDRQQAVQSWRDRLHLSKDSPPQAIKTRLAELDQVLQMSQALGDARSRKARHDAVTTAFHAQAAEMATRLGESLSAGTPSVAAAGGSPQAELSGPPQASTAADEFTDRLAERLAESHEQAQQGATLTHELALADARYAQALGEQATQTERLSALCAAAGVRTPDELPEREAADQRKRQLHDRLATLEEQIRKASDQTETDLRTRLAQWPDAAALERARSSGEAAIQQIKEARTSAREKEEEARRALLAVDASDAAAQAREALDAAASRFAMAIRPWARLRLAHALLQQALTRFRERAQAPMILAGSTYFSLMTAGRYTRLVADDSGSQPVLRAQRPDGSLIGLEAMSEGTADQLYLALRLAALELRREARPEMPLVLDDVLVTSDDARAACILQALAQFARASQVIVFTHHQHLADLARDTLGGHTIAIHTIEGPDTLTDPA